MCCSLLKFSSPESFVDFVTPRISFPLFMTKTLNVCTYIFNPYLSSIPDMNADTFLKCIFSSPEQISTLIKGCYHHLTLETGFVSCLF